MVSTDTTDGRANAAQPARLRQPGLAEVTAAPRLPSVIEPEHQPLPPVGPGQGRALARGLFWLAIGLSLVGLGLELWAIVRTGSFTGVELHTWFGAPVTLTYAVVGALVASRLPRHPIGWICSAVGVLSGLNTLGAGYRLADHLGVLLPGYPFVYWLDLWVWIPVTLLPLTFLLLLFPDGHLPSARWRPIGWAAGLGIVVYALSVALHPSPAIEPTPTPNPFGIPGLAGVLEALLIPATILMAVGAVGAVASVVLRFRRAQGIARAQLKWLVYAGVIGLLGNVLIDSWGASHQVEAAAYNVMLLGIITMLGAIGAAVGIAILRHNLYDIDLLINRSLVYGALTVFIVGSYGLVVGTSEVVLHQSGSLPLSLLVTGLIAILFQPLRERLQRMVNRLLYGERDDPYAVLSRLGQRLESALAPEAVLPALVETIGQALKLPYVAVLLQAPGQGGPAAGDPHVVAAYGQHNSQAISLPLHYQSECVGELWVAPRGPGESFTPAEQRLLNDIAHQAGVAAHAVRLTADLQRSRERLVTALEEERRRLRRDLHDGLGPEIASQTLKLEAAHDALPADPGRAAALLVELLEQSQTMLAEVRRLVYALRPPALDELGLVGAVREQAAQCELANLQVSLSAPQPLPPLPAAVEVAAYRIIQEALTNVLRHAQASACSVSMQLVSQGKRPMLRVEIRDDGVGLPPQHRAGVGLASMRERAEELGGWCLAEAGPRGGTCVSAGLPAMPAEA